jgi:hypothetical protein
MWLSYNNDLKIHVVFEWIPNPKNYSGGERYLLVTGRLSTFEKNYLPILMLFIIAFMAVGSITAITYFFLANNLTRHEAKTKEAIDG